MSLHGARVLVTGADGFIGSHLTERLVELGARVRVFCFYNSNGSLGWLDQCRPEIRDELDVKLGDIRDARYVDEACRGVEVVFHLAALIAIPYSYQAPESFLDTNVKGTLNVLEGVRRAGCSRMIHTSTSEVYGTPENLPIRETHPLQGQSPYSASKIGADKLCEAYHCSFDVPVVVLRPFNTYGPRQSMRAVIPTILVQLLRNQGVVRLGRVDPRRDLTYVSDTVNGFVLAAESEGIEGEVIQLGTGDSLSVEEVFRAACVVLRREPKLVTDDRRLRPSRSEVMVLQSDPAKAKALIGWQAAVPLGSGILETASWIEAHLADFSADSYQV